MNAVALPLNDPSQWPLRMTKAETAHVLRWSVKTLERKVRAGVVPLPDADRFFIRAEIEHFLKGNVRQFDKRRKKVA